MLLLVRRVVFLMMLLARRWSIVFLLSMDLTFFVSHEDELVDLDEELVDHVEELVDAHVLRKSFLELRREVLLDVVELVGLDWLRHDMNLEGHVAPQVLELHVVVVLAVVPRRLVHLDVVALAPLVLVVVGVAVLVLVRMQLGFDDVDALESRCRVEDCG